MLFSKISSTTWIINIDNLVQRRVVYAIIRYFHWRQTSLKSGGAEWEFETYLVKFETYSVLRDYETKKNNGCTCTRCTRQFGAYDYIRKANYAAFRFSELQYVVALNFLFIFSIPTINSVFNHTRMNECKKSLYYTLFCTKLKF